MNCQDHMGVRSHDMGGTHAKMDCVWNALLAVTLLALLSGAAPHAEALEETPAMHATIADYTGLETCAQCHITAVARDESWPTLLAQDYRVPVLGAVRILPIYPAGPKAG